MGLAEFAILILFSHTSLVALPNSISRSNFLLISFPIAFHSLNVNRNPISLLSVSQLLLQIKVLERQKLTHKTTTTLLEDTILQN